MMSATRARVRKLKARLDHSNGSAPDANLPPPERELLQLHYLEAGPQTKIASLLEGLAEIATRARRSAHPETPSDDARCVAADLPAAREHSTSSSLGCAQ